MTKKALTDKELMTKEEWRAWKQFNKLLKEPMTTQEFIDKTPKLRELLKKTPTTKQLKQRKNKH